MTAIVLLTDFGTKDYYCGQVHAVFARLCPQFPVIDLCHHLPAFTVQSSAFLLAELVRDFPMDTVFFCVVDPGVGGCQRPLVLRSGQQWFVGPDNGLFSVLQQRASSMSCYEILWRPDTLSRTFHGRDLYAPVVAGLAMGAHLPMRLLDRMVDPVLEQVADATMKDFWQVIYIDHYGNCITGIHAAVVSHRDSLRVGNHEACYREAFFAATAGELFWYRNSLGLVELSMSAAAAATQAGIGIGDRVLRSTSA